MTDLAYLGAIEALEHFRSGALSPVELMREHASRIASINCKVNALTETMLDEALDAARDAERAYTIGSHQGRAVGEPGTELLGLPVAAKEKHAIAGRTLSQGLSFEASTIATNSHPIVDRIRGAGGIIHARTTSPEFSCATVTHSPLWGVTRNPWNLRCSPGGSSGGAGAALAAGFTTLATASDIAGSTRLPAAFCGVVGYKAPYGRIPGVGPLAADWYRGDGPMARTVADAALLANVMSGRAAMDHRSLPAATRLPLRFGPPEGLRVALCIRLGDYRVSPDVEANTRQAGAALEAAGCVVEEIELPWTSRGITDTAFAHFGTILAPAISKAIERHEDEVAAYTRQFVADALAAAERKTLFDTLASEEMIQNQLASAMAGFDALLCPTSAVSQLEADGEYLHGIAHGGAQLAHYWEGHMTVPFNIANRCPVLAVPSGLSDDGVPIGVQVVGHPFDEETVFQIGAALEQSAPLSSRRPSL